MNPAGRTFAVLLTTLVAAAGAHAQDVDDARRAYFTAVADFFNLPPTEVVILSDWDLAPAEVPALLFVARRAGVSPEALVALRRADRSWADLLEGYGIDAATLHLPVREHVEPGVLSGAYAQYRSTPVTEWRRIRLEDRHIVGLINVRVISQSLGLSAEEVARQTEPSISYVQLYDRLRR